MRNLIATLLSILCAFCFLFGCTSKPASRKNLPVSAAVQQLHSERIVYSAFDAATTDQPMILDIFMMNADGTNQTNLTKSRIGEADPASSPDGNLIAYAVYIGEKPGKEGIFVMKTDGSAIRRVTPLGMVACAPDWSLDGKHLIFCSVKWKANNYGGHDPTWRVYRIDLDGKNLRSLCEGWLPSWSPNGKSLLYTRLEGNSGKASLHIRNIDGSKDRSLTSPTDPWLNVKGTFSPNGSRIVYVGEGKKISAIWIMNADGSQKKRLTTGKYKDDAPYWSLDGNYLYFTRGGEGFTLSAVWIMDANGANPKPLTSGGKAFTNAGFAFPAISFVGIGAK